MDLCRLGTDERATGPHPAQKMTSARFREFAKHFNAFHCSTRCVRCAVKFQCARASPATWDNHSMY